MTYNYNITRYRSIKDTRLWTDRIFLGILLATLATTYYNSTASNLLYPLTGFMTLAALALLITRQQTVPFVGIADGTLTYFDSIKR